MTPLSDQRETFAKVTFLGNTEVQSESPAAPFSYFYSLLDVLVENPDPKGGGSCSADAFQVAQFFPAGISMSGATAGSWNVEEGSYGGHSLTSFSFRLDACVEYQLDVSFDYGDFPDPGGGADLAHRPGPARRAVRLPGRHRGDSCDRTPGSGRVRTRGRSSFWVGSGLESVSGPTYSVIWTVAPCTTSLIAVQPVDLDVACGATATFSVTPDPGAGSPSYQWRRNAVPLANSSHVTGVTTPTLMIDSACDADFGYYDVVLDNGTIVEPSRLARLGVTATTDAEGAPEGPQRIFTLLAAGPNPSREASVPLRGQESATRDDGDLRHRGRENSHAGGRRSRGIGHRDLGRKDRRGRPRGGGNLLSFESKRGRSGRAAGSSFSSDRSTCRVTPCGHPSGWPRQVFATKCALRRRLSADISG